MLPIKRGLMALSLFLIATCGGGPSADLEPLSGDGVELDGGPDVDPGGSPMGAGVDEDVDQNPCDQY